MAKLQPTTGQDAAIGERVRELFDGHLQGIRAKTDRLMAALMAGQWVFAVVIAVVYSPYGWEGKVRSVHAHVYAATLLGAAISSVPIFLAITRPGAPSTRYVIACGQMLWSALLIHLTGGRIETHFHVFGSLAFLAFYRDWKVFIPATIVVASDHLARQLFWPESVYGVINPEWWRFLEHAFWVVFEDVFLILACLRGVAELRDISWQHAALEAASERERLRSTQLDALLAESLAAKDVAERANQVKGQFLANMSHELRTPINGVLGMTELLGRTPLSAKQRQYVDAASGSGKSLLLVVNDILDFSKVDAGKLALEETPFSPAAVAQNVADLFAAPAQRKGVELACDVPPELSRSVLGDPGRLQQVLNNLVANAVKFTEKGEVVLRGRIASEANGEIVLRFEVQDTGIGVPEEHRGRLFEAFSQVDSSHSRKYGGTGLGLAIAKQLVEMMGGQIGFDSAGHGSTFWFTVRFLRDSDEEAALSAPAALRGCRVLVVDDNATNRVIVKDQLASWALAVDCAEDGRAALEMFAGARAASRPYGLVILDMQMPGMDGLAVARALHELEKPTATPIIMLTSVVEAGLAEETRRAGIADCAAKPVHSHRLLERIRVVLGAPLPSAAPAEVKAAPLSRARLLLVEDNLVNQMVALEMLAELGYEADVAGDGAEALEALEKKAYAAVLMDCQMPRLNGYDATREIRRREVDRRTPIIGLTAHAMAGDDAKALAVGMDDYLTKPLTIQKLGGVVERWIHGSARRERTPVAPSRAPRAVLDPEVRRSAKVIELFLTQLPQATKRLGEAARANDAALVRQEAHRLKGSCVSIGASALAKCCADIEARPDAYGVALSLARSSAPVTSALEAELVAARSQTKVAAKVLS